MTRPYLPDGLRYTMDVSYVDMRNPKKNPGYYATSTTGGTGTSTTVNKVNFGSLDFNLTGLQLTGTIRLPDETIQEIARVAKASTIMTPRKKRKRVYHDLECDETLSQTQLTDLEKERRLANVKLRALWKMHGREKVDKAMDKIAKMKELDD